MILWPYHYNLLKTLEPADRKLVIYILKIGIKSESVELICM